MARLALWLLMMALSVLISERIGLDLNRFTVCVQAGNSAVLAASVSLFALEHQRRGHPFAHLFGCRS
jgi:hypothetical protein